MSPEQKRNLEALKDLRRSIDSDLCYMIRILKDHFPNEYDTAYQHWIPQIFTALYNDTKWLNRGQYSVQDTIDHISDDDNTSGGVTKYIGDKNGH